MESYKSLIVWQRASQVCLSVLQQTDESWKPRSAVVFEQLRRAALSVDLNIVEGYALNTVPLFRKHLRIAIGSAAETERLIEIAVLRKYLDSSYQDQIQPQIDGTFRALLGLLRSPKLRTERS